MAPTTDRPPGAHDVAALIIREQLAAERPIDKMQLQKFLYIVQGAHFTLWDSPAFREPLSAYRNGPVVKNVESSYRVAFPNTWEIDHAIGGDADRVPESVRDSVDMVLDCFGMWTGPELEAFTKQPGAPWHAARGPLPPADPSDVPMSAEEVRVWFRLHGVKPNAPAPTDRTQELFQRAADGDVEALTELMA